MFTKLLLLIIHRSSWELYVTKYIIPSLSRLRKSSENLVALLNKLVTLKDRRVLVVTSRWCCYLNLSIYQKCHLHTKFHNHGIIVLTSIVRGA